jgi:hypothetical protein
MMTENMDVPLRKKATITQVEHAFTATKDKDMTNQSLAIATQKTARVRFVDFKTISIGGLEFGLIRVPVYEDSDLDESVNDNAEGINEKHQSNR